MECEVQPRVHKKGKGRCDICLQLTGRGIAHKCKRKDIKSQKFSRGRSITRETATRRKQNLLVLVGKKATTAQEQIVSSALERIKNRKGESFHLKIDKGGGSKGKGKTVHVGKVQRNTEILPIDMFKDIKKSSNQ